MLEQLLVEKETLTIGIGRGFIAFNRAVLLQKILFHSPRL